MTGAARSPKKMAGYHQFHAVETAVTETLRAARLQQQGLGGARSAGPLRVRSATGGCAG